MLIQKEKEKKEIVILSQQARAEALPLVFIQKHHNFTRLFFLLTFELLGSDGSVTELPLLMFSVFFEMI